MRLGKRQREAKRLTIAANFANRSKPAMPSNDPLRTVGTPKPSASIGRVSTITFETPRLRDGSFVQEAAKATELSRTVNVLRF